MNPTHRGDTKQRGFTLVELLVVIAIIGSLAGILVPTVMIVRKKAKKTTDINNLKRISEFCVGYTTGNKKFFPWPDDAAENPPAYLSYEKIANLMRDDFSPKLIVSPVQSDEPVEGKEGKSWKVGKDNSSYTYFSKRTRPEDKKSTNGVLGSNMDWQREGESSEGHEDGVAIARFGGDAEFIEMGHDLLGGDENMWRFPPGLVDDDGKSGDGN